MKKSFIACALAFSLVSCNCPLVDDNPVTEPETVQIQATPEEGMRIGFEILTKAHWVNAEHLTPDELEYVDSLADKIAEDDNDIDSMISLIEFLNTLPIFGDTVAEDDIWFEWVDWYFAYQHSM